MNIIKLINQLTQISLVQAIETSDHSIHVSNALKNFQIELNPEEISDAHFISSPTGEKVLQIYFGSGGIIVTPDDYVFDVVQDEIMQVEDAPPMCSISEMLLGYEHYKINPLLSTNFDNCVGQFYMHYYIFKSAKLKGFNVDSYLNELESIGQKFGLKY